MRSSLLQALDRRELFLGGVGLYVGQDIECLHGFERLGKFFSGHDAVDLHAVGDDEGSRLGAELRDG